PCYREKAKGLPVLHFVIAREAGQRFGKRLGAQRVATHHLEHEGVHVPVSDRADVRNSADSRDEIVDRSTRAIDLTLRPSNQRQINHCGDADVLAEMKTEIAVALGIVKGERFFEVVARFFEVPSEPFCYSVDAMSHARFR